MGRKDRVTLRVRQGKGRVERVEVLQAKKREKGENGVGGKSKIGEKDRQGIDPSKMTT